MPVLSPCIAFAFFASLSLSLTPHRRAATLRAPALERPSSAFPSERHPAPDTAPLLASRLPPIQSRELSGPHAGPNATERERGSRPYERALMSTSPVGVVGVPNDAQLSRRALVPRVELRGRMAPRALLRPHAPDSVASRATALVRHDNPQLPLLLLPSVCSTACVADGVRRPSRRCP